MPQGPPVATNSLQRLGYPVSSGMSAISRRSTEPARNPLFLDRPSSSPSSQPTPATPPSTPRNSQFHSESHYQDQEGSSGYGEEVEDEDGVIMAIDHRGRKIGCAFYSASDQKLSLMEDLEFPTPDCLDACEYEPPQSTLRAD